MIRMSVSDLESYRYWKAMETGDLQLLITRLQHREIPTPEMMAGRAFAKLMENAAEETILQQDVDGWRFAFNLDTEFSIPPVRELKAEQEFDTPNGPVLLVGKVDGLRGLAVHDQKLTERFDAERYTDSLQWRAYLTMFEATEFVYDVFVCTYAGNFVNIYDYQRLPFYAYPEMRKDVELAVSELAEVITRYIPQAA